MKTLLTIAAISVTLTFLSSCTDYIEPEVKPTDAPVETSHPIESPVPTEVHSELLKYQSKDGWTIQYPASWDKITDSTLQESATEKYISFETHDIPEEGVEKWMDSEIERKLSSEEADNKLLENVTKETKGDFTVYKYAIQSAYVRPTNISELRNIIYVGNEHIYEFRAPVPPLTKEEFENIVETFTFVPTEVLTEQDIYDFDLLRADWSKDKMEEIGLKKEVNDGAGETNYSNEIVKYTYFDYFEEATPAVVHVFGDHPGPRGISVGDTFDEVMSLFPQNEDWKTNSYGVFYGQFDKYKEYPIGLTGYVRTDDNGDKAITFTTENSPWMRIFFQGDEVKNYTIYLLRRD